MQQVDLSSGQLVAGRYAIDRELGKGGMGRVYLAHQRPFDRPVVIKIMHPKYLADDNLRQRFFNEARAASQLSHPNSITVFDFGKTEDEVYFIAMEYVDGMTLREALEDGAMPLDRVAPIIVQVAQSLGEAHRKSIIHRDLKPENIMLGRPGTADEFVKVLDFGIAKVLDSQTGITQTGSVFGTPGYMAPEQGRAEEIDHTVDLYSLTCCFYELLTGTMPFGGESALQVMMSHQSEPVPSLPDHLPPGLNDFIRTGMAKSAHSRPKDADHYVAALLASLSRETDSDVDATGTPENGVERAGTGQILQGRTHSPSVASRSSDQIGAPTNSIPSPDDINRTDETRASGTNPSPPPSDDESLPRPNAQGGTAPKATRRVDSNPLRSEIERADTRPKVAADSMQTPRSSQRYPVANSGRQSPSGELAAHDSGPTGPTPDGPQHPSPARGVQQQTPVQHASAHSNSTQRDSTQRNSTQRNSTQHTPAPPNTETESRTSDSGGAAKYWAIAATVISGILAVVVIVLNLENPQPIAEESGMAAGAADQSVSVSIDSRPSEALVRIDGKEVGLTPTSYSARADETVQISLSKVGYETREITHAVGDGTGDQRVFAALDARLVELTISVPVDGTEVLIGGESYGKLGADNPRLIKLQWPEDDLRVVLRHDDFEDYIQRFPASAIDSSLELDPRHSDLVSK